MKKIFLLSCFLLSAISFAQELKFKHNGKMVYTFLQKKCLDKEVSIQKAKLTQTQVQLHNAWRGQDRTYVGYEFYSLLNAVYGEKWQSSSRMVLRALDGYVVVMKIKKMLEASKEKNSSGLIACREADKKGFSPVEKGTKKMDPGPFYLVWSHFDNKSKANYADSLKWPYQLVDIDLID